jgi:nucleoside-diphosphate-sugar epimerase
MKLTVFGGTGKTGKLLIQRALADGHQVIAFARNPAKLQMESDRLSVIHGNLSDMDAIERAVSGSDAVISLLGPSGNVKDTSLSSGMERILSAMKGQGVHRIVAISTPSVPDPNDLPDFKFKCLVTMVKTAVPGAYNEIVRIGDAVRSSGLQWTLVRVPLLTDKPKTGRVRVGYLGQGSVRIRLSRSDLAQFLLEQVHDTRYIHKSPVISN